VRDHDNVLLVILSHFYLKLQFCLLEAKYFILLDIVGSENTNNFCMCRFQSFKLRLAILGERAPVYTVDVTKAFVFYRDFEVVWDEGACFTWPSPGDSYRFFREGPALYTTSTLVAIALLLAAEASGGYVLIRTSTSTGVIVFSILVLTAVLLWVTAALVFIFVLLWPVHRLLVLFKND